MNGRSEFSPRKVWFCPPPPRCVAIQDTEKVPSRLSLHCWSHLANVHRTPVFSEKTSILSFCSVFIKRVAVERRWGIKIWSNEIKANGWCKGRMRTTPLYNQQSHSEGRLRQQLATFSYLLPVHYVWVMMRHCIVINLAPKLEIWEFARHTLVSCFREVVKKHSFSWVSSVCEKNRCVLVPKPFLVGPIFQIWERSGPWGLTPSPPLRLAWPWIIRFLTSCALLLKHCQNWQD